MEIAERDRIFRGQKNKGNRMSALGHRILKVALGMSTAVLVALVSCLMAYGVRQEGTTAWGRIMWDDKSPLSFVTIVEQDDNKYHVIMFGGVFAAPLDRKVKREWHSLGFSWVVPWQMNGRVWQIRIPYWFLIASTLILDVGCVYFLLKRREARWGKPID